MIDHDMTCRTCLYQLNVITVGDSASYEHPILPQADHETIAVPTRRTPLTNGRCHVCQFYLPLWTIRTSPFDMGFVSIIDPRLQISTVWNVCDFCFLLIEQRDISRLSTHAISRKALHPDVPAAQFMHATQLGIIEKRLPGRTLVTTTRWSPATLKAATLPKVRDRLGALMRGRHELPLRLSDRDLRGDIADGLERARLFWIDPQITALIGDVAADLPDTTVTERIVPSSSGLLVWAKAVDDRYDLAAAGWTPHGSGWEMTCYRSIGADLPEARLQAVRQDVGWLIPVHSAHVRSGATVNGADPLAALVSSWLLIHQELAETEPAPVDPTIRKQYQRARRQPPEVRLVRLKPRPAQQSQQSARSDPEKPQRKAPDYRYWVSEHVRQQPYGPQSSLRRETSIAPYLKGPEGRPIKASTTVRVLRQRPSESAAD